MGGYASRPKLKHERARLLEKELKNEMFEQWQFDVHEEWFEEAREKIMGKLPVVSATQS